MKIYSIKVSNMKQTTDGIWTYFFKESIAFKTITGNCCIIIAKHAIINIKLYVIIAFYVIILTYFY